VGISLKKQGKNGDQYSPSTFPGLIPGLTTGRHLTTVPPAEPLGWLLHGDVVWLVQVRSEGESNDGGTRSVPPESWLPSSQTLHLLFSEFHPIFLCSSKIFVSATDLQKKFEMQLCDVA
jgi:hypothetical protein